MCSSLDVTNLMESTVVSKWKVEKKLAQGDFSHIYLVSGNGKTPHYTKFALKCESADNSLQMLKVEAYVLQKITEKVKRHFCDVEDIGKNQGIHYIVMQLLGRPLVDYMKSSPTGVISVNCALSVGIQIYEALDDLHGCGFIHRDLKPSNICLGRLDRGELSKVFMLSFSIARKFLDSNGEVRPARDNVEFRGTVRYASLNCHKLVELSRKDDLESTFYVIIEMITGILPWKGLPDSNSVFNVKQSARYSPGIYQFLKGSCPVEPLKELLLLIDSYNYSSKPDYNQIYTILRKAIRQNPHVPEHPYDWERGGKIFLEDL